MLHFGQIGWILWPLWKARLLKCPLRNQETAVWPILDLFGNPLTPRNLFPSTERCNQRCKAAAPDFQTEGDAFVDHSKEADVRRKDDVLTFR
ncbi:hypothetical protein TNCV_1489701 [Trichonephila clavipes]|nr:hypothetical protein TNCV_1489701 [Trichonephila clavipes]